MATLKLNRMTQTAYNALETVDQSTIYFISDTGALYVRGSLYGGKIVVLENATDPTAPELNTLYVYPNNQIKTYDGTSLKVVAKGNIEAIVADSEAEGYNVDNTTVPTTKAVVDFVLNAIDEAESGVTDVTLTDSEDSSKKILTVSYAKEDAKTYEFDVNTAVTAGKYDPETQNIYLTLAEDKTYTDPTKLVVIPAGDLVDVYTADEETIHEEDNQFSVIISKADDNILDVADDGLYVPAIDLGEKEDEIVTVDAEGGIVASGKKVGGEALATTVDANTVATEKAVKDYADSLIEWVNWN